MIRPICRDPLLLSRKAREATPADLPIALDLRDTLAANADRCVGMAANMIGEPVAIICFDCAGEYKIMLNPVLLVKKDAYTAEEGCLSLSGVRTVKRYRFIRVCYKTPSLESKIEDYTGWTAEIVQHEIDHLSGILI